MPKLRSVTWLKISGFCGLLTPIVAFSCIFLAIYFAPEFSWTHNALSDLGVMPGVTAALFNYGLIASGVLGLIFATSLPNAASFLKASAAEDKMGFMPHRGQVGAMFFLSACIALTAIGVFPEDAKPMHFIASVAFFVLLICALLSLGIGLWQLKQKQWAAFTLLLGAVAAAPWLLLFVVRYVSGVAVPEFIAAVAGGLWAAIFGFKMLRLASHTKAS
ncbi:MAG: DUF998 domain-containing protein [Candidatus Bathyarchaeia archaeon]